MRSKMKNNVIKAAGIQIFCNTSKQGMLEKAEKYIEQAIQNYPDIDLFVLPEQFYHCLLYTSMDSNDLKLVNAFISNINMQEFSKEKSVVVDLNTLGKEVVDYHVGKNVLNKISNSCRKLVEYNFS